MGQLCINLAPVHSLVVFVVLILKKILLTDLNIVLMVLIGSIYFQLSTSFVDVVFFYRLKV